MAQEPAPDNSQFRHKKEGYTVTVEHSAPQGVTLFRRDVAAIRKLRTKRTDLFLKEFVRVHPNPATDETEAK